MMDDILVIGKTREDHDNRLEEVVTRIEGAGMTLNKEKCEYGVQKVKFVGGSRGTIEGVGQEEK